MKLLTFTTLYPNDVMNHHGVFVENRLRYLVADTDIETRVIAPVPWFPVVSSLFKSYEPFSRVAKTETRNNIVIHHPRYLNIPKFGMSLAPFLLAASVIGHVKKLIRSGYDFDVIDAHYFYPDGVAAIIIGIILNKPVVITARGTDLNLIPDYYIPRNLIRWAASRTSKIITVCNALKEVLIKMGVDENHIRTLRNGVDLRMFQPPNDREKLRSELGLRDTVILSVGHLIDRKGHDLVIKALNKLKNTTLIIAGDGPNHNKLFQLVDELRLADKVRFLGSISHNELCKYYGAADLLVLASDREGWANVLLESMACGTPVVATNIWGTPEVVAKPEAGILAGERTPESLAKAILQILDKYPDRLKTRKYAESFSWEDTTLGQYNIFKEIQAANNK